MGDPMGQKVSDAVQAAADWVERQGERLPGFFGAYLSGSVLEKSGEEQWEESSDVDVVVILEDVQAFWHKKFLFEGFLLEISPIALGEFCSLEHILHTHYLAWGLSHEGILSDPTGRLRELHLEVKRRWQEKECLTARCEGFLQKVEQGGIPTKAPLQDKATAWAFGAGIAVFPLLTASGRNCTVRRRFSALREVLQEYGPMELMEELTGVLTGPRFQPEGLSGYLDRLEEVYDCACRSSGRSSAWRFREEVSPQARACAIDGTRRVLESPYPQDAVFWMLATYCRCFTVFWLDDRALWREKLPLLQNFLGFLGIHEDRDLSDRYEAVRELLPRVREASHSILRARGIF